MSIKPMKYAFWRSDGYPYCIWGEVVEEKISLSERFGLWLSFYPPKQDEYLEIVAHWLKHFGLTNAQIELARSEALVWALERGSRSGRVAWQFAKHWAGSHAS